MYVVLAIVGGLLVYLKAPNLSLSGSGVVTIGVIVSFLGMARQLSQTIGQASMQVSMIAMGLAGASRVFALIDEKPEEDEGYVTLVRAEWGADGTLKETNDKNGIWAWKVFLPTHLSDSCTDNNTNRVGLRLILSHHLQYKHIPARPQSTRMKMHTNV